MRQRITSAIVAIILGVIILFFYNIIVLNIVIAVIIYMAEYEVLITTRYVSDRKLFAICSTFAALVPFLRVPAVKHYDYAFCYIFILALFIYLIAKHRSVRLELIGMVFLLTMLLAFSLSCIVFIRDLYYVSKPDAARGLFYICLLLFGAWMTDAGAYFIGVFFGKHKLAPQISPKKTIEGAIGGVLFTLITFFLAVIVYGLICKKSGVVISVNYPALVIASLLCSVAAILGDLSASLIKRECKIKDFGNILPGHGGVLDRFDSVMFVAPLMYIFLMNIPIIR